MKCEWCRQRKATTTVEVRRTLEIHACRRCKRITEKRDPIWDRYLGKKAA